MNQVFVCDEPSQIAMFPSRKLRCYVAGPYEKGDVACNVRSAILAADAILEAGHLPYLPHLNHFWHLLRPHFREQWLELDHAWLVKCDVLVRLPGESEGADREVEWARQAGITVYFGLETLLATIRGGFQA